MKRIENNQNLIRKQYSGRTTLAGAELVCVNPRFKTIYTVWNIGLTGKNPTPALRAHKEDLALHVMFRVC